MSALSSLESNGLVDAGQDATSKSCEQWKLTILELCKGTPCCR